VAEFRLIVAVLNLMSASCSSTCVQGGCKLSRCCDGWTKLCVCRHCYTMLSATHYAVPGFPCTVSGAKFPGGGGHSLAGGTGNMGNLCCYVCFVFPGRFPVGPWQGTPCPDSIVALLTRLSREVQMSSLVRPGNSSLVKGQGTVPWKLPCGALAGNALPRQCSSIAYKIVQGSAD
jgi:hypothetical protein